MAICYSYPIDLHEEPEGGFSVTFPDFEEAFTDGDSIAEAISEAADCLEEALAGRILRRDDIPAPSPARGRRCTRCDLGCQDGPLRGSTRRKTVHQRFRAFHGCPRKRSAPNARSWLRHKYWQAGGSVGPLRKTLGGFRGGSRLISPLWSLLGRRAGRRRERLSLDLSSCSQNRRRYIERRSGIKYLPLVGHRIVDRRPHRLWPRRSFAQDASVHPRGVGLACSSLVSGG